MQLHEYPSAIASLQIQLLDLNQRVEQISQDLNRICNQFEFQVAFDPELKNEQQRKAKKADLVKQSGDYEQSSKALNQEVYKRDLTMIQLEQLKNEFAVLKLTKRESVARLEAFQQVGV